MLLTWSGSCVPPPCWSYCHCQCLPLMQGFCRESQGRSKSVTHYVVRLEGKLNKIQIKLTNRVSEVETTGYIQDCLFYGLRKLLQRSTHAHFDNPLNDYMALMWVPRKVEVEHEQEKHNTSYASKLGVVSDALFKQAGNGNQDTKASIQEPWLNWVKM